jgi:hypothetical protein
MIATRDLRGAMHKIAARKGDFTLFALFMRADAPFMRADAPGTWDLVASAPWLEAGNLKVLRELVDLLVKSIGRKALQEFSKVEAVASDDPRVQFILDSVAVEDGVRRIESTDLKALQIESAIVFRAWRPGAKNPPAQELAAAGPSRSR